MAPCAEAPLSGHGSVGSFDGFLSWYQPCVVALNGTPKGKPKPIWGAPILRHTHIFLNEKTCFFVFNGYLLVALCVCLVVWFGKVFELHVLGC